MDFIPKEIQQYSDQHTDAEPPLLSKLNRDTHAHVMMPRMLSGHFQGRLLSMIAKMIRPRRILEIGTYTGYSAICMAEGLQDGGQIVTIDINEELESKVRGYFKEAGLSNVIDYRIGDAREIVKTLDMQFQLVFVDADKASYRMYYDMIIDGLPSGAWILADNVLWSGKVVPSYTKNDKDTQALREYNHYVHQDPRVENLLLPIRDGILIARKK
ncbi:MAG: O-methyltransferase [Cyclobacteriaceae bacterium]|nr:O-methyltransferase [Cyclobacteriaceae bacterium]MCH8516656.1 O-methyltransferase [Cyclobacteriaceae bacterium]